MTFQQYCQDWFAKRNKHYTLDEIQSLLNEMISDPYHNGDCVKEAQPCLLCWVEELLTKYRIEYADRKYLKK